MAQQGRRSALVHFPESLTPAGSRDLCFAPFWSGAGPAPMELAGPALHTTAVESDTPPSDEALGWPPSGATLAHHQKHNRRPIARDGDRFIAWIGCQRSNNLPVILIPQVTDRLSVQVGDERTCLGIGDWSPWLPVYTDASGGRVRFKLLALDLDRDHVELLQSQITVPATTASDPHLAESLIERHGPFISKWAVTCSPDEHAFETSYEEGAYQLGWLTDAAMTLLNEHDFDLFATVFRLNDETHHTCLAQCDPQSVFYTPDRAERYLEVIRRAYRVLDNGVGRLLAQRDDNTLIVLASDHGDVPNHYLCDIHRRLAVFGLCVLDDDGRPLVAQSQTYLKDERGGLEIFVNLAGRDLHGIVAPDNYADIQAQILKALNTWYHDTPEGERNVVALALAKRDARVIGYWGPHAGDVIFAYNQGFVWGTNRAGDTVASVHSPGANHGPQVPTAHTNFASNDGLAIWYGDGVRSSGSLAGRRALHRMDDLGTTLAAHFNLSGREGLDGRAFEQID